MSSDIFPVQGYLASSYAGVGTSAEQFLEARMREPEIELENANSEILEQ